MKLEKMIKSLYVGGTFDDDRGKFSSIADTIYQAMQPSNMDYYNGGGFEQLESLIRRIEDYGLIFWFANVPNDKPKIVKQIKKKHNSCVLVTSKRNDRIYSTADVIHHALENKSNLLVEFVKDERYKARIIDPLGNVFLDYCNDFGVVGNVLKKRVNELMRFTRIPSRQVGDKIEAPNEPEFFEIVRQYGERFHELIHAKPESTSRFLGNASFRCEHGFPSFLKDGLIYVSRRNIDKRAINKEGFVAVKQELPIEYYGIDKPSVDTPIQIRLYSYYEDVRYMLHSHVFVKDAPSTNSIIPCGAIEEADEVIGLFPSKGKTNFAVNLKGHGSIAFLNKLEYMKQIEYLPRSLEIVHEDYAR